MIKIIVSVFIALMPISFITMATLPAIKDPFFMPTIITCDELEQQFISQFSGWQYQGLVRLAVDEKNSVITVWLTNQKQWLQMSLLNPSTQFSSWHIVVIRADYIKWQAELPAYCNKQLTFTMTFLGRDMKRSAITKIIFLIVSSYFTTATNAENKDSRLSLTFHQTPTTIILQALADYQQLNLIVDAGIDPVQTIKLHDIDWHKALALITRNAKLQFEIVDNLLMITELPDPQSLLIQKQQQQQEFELAQPLKYLALPISHHEIKSLLHIILQQNILSERGKAFIDERSNTLVISDISQNVAEIKRLTELLDQPIPQVHIAAHIVTMSDESSAELGIKWGYQGSSAQWLNKFDSNLGSVNPINSIGFNLAKRSGNLLNLELSALEAENQLEIIASPNLITSHKNTASIKQGTEIPYEVSSGSNGATSIEFKQAVLGLEVTPRILPNNLLELTLYITQNMAGRSIKRSDGGEALAIDTQEIRTQVLVNSGETLVLGGIFQQSHRQESSAVPGLSQVPILGQLFQSSGKKQQKRELVIFITPQLIHF